MTEVISDFWKGHWEEQSREQDGLIAAGWGKRDIKEYLFDLQDIYKKLMVAKEDILLNIGCGNGLFEIATAYFVDTINAVDFSQGMLERAKENNAIHKNVNFYHGNILDLSFLEKKHSKVLCNSVIQYLNNVEEVAGAFASIDAVCQTNTRILIAANPDLKKQDEFLKGYDKLDLSKDQIKEKKEACKKALWTDPDELVSLAKKLNFQATILPMNNNVWQSCYMFDLLLWRD